MTTLCKTTNQITRDKRYYIVLNGIKKRISSYEYCWHECGKQASCFQTVIVGDVVQQYKTVQESKL